MRLIDADRFYNVLHDLGGCGAKPESYADGWDKAIDNAISQLEDAPTIEAEPVKRGQIVKKKRVIGGVEHYKCPECSHKWQKDKRCKIDELFCSECGKVLADNFLNYCPNCGAKMEGEK